jgi:type IV/VI secretion system ImpK/VasF family protein
MDEIIDTAIRHITSLRRCDETYKLESIEVYCTNLQSSIANASDRLDTDYIHDLSYCIIAAIDESILSNPKLAADWISKPMITTLYGDRNGGDHFYEIINKYTDNNKPTDLKLLKTAYLILLFGFEGKNGVLNGIKKLTLGKLEAHFSHYQSITTNNTLAKSVAHRHHTLLTLSCMVFFSSALLTYEYINNYIKPGVYSLEKRITHIIRKFNAPI